MILLWIYLGLCFIWACFAVYKNMTSYSFVPSLWLNFVTFVLNFLIFPVAVGIAIKTKKLL